MLPVDVNRERLGLHRLERLHWSAPSWLTAHQRSSEAAAEKIEAARKAGPFSSLDDFVRRTGLSQAVVSKLADADAFSSLAIDRRARYGRR